MKSHRSALHGLIMCERDYARLDKTSQNQIAPERSALTLILSVITSTYCSVCTVTLHGFCNTMITHRRFSKEKVRTVTAICIMIKLPLFST